MNGTERSWIWRRRRTLVAVAIPLLFAAWWAFRPEKLLVNKKVSEPAPFSSTTDLQPLYTGATRRRGAPNEWAGHHL